MKHCLSCNHSILLQTWHLGLPLLVSDCPLGNAVDENFGLTTLHPGPVQVIYVYLCDEFDV